MQAASPLIVRAALATIVANAQADPNTSADAATCPPAVQVEQHATASPGCEAPRTGTRRSWQVRKTPPGMALSPTLAVGAGRFSTSLA